MNEEELKKKIEKKYLKIRGWKNWEQYDEIRQSSDLDKNTREELINICIQQAKSEAKKEFEKMCNKVNNLEELKDAIKKM